MDGRYDIVVFGNGGWECIGRINSEPEVSVQELHDKAQQFVDGLDATGVPVKYTGTYNPDDNPVIISWDEWQGEMPVDEKPEEDMI